jgi:hypothetical protein
VIVPEDPISKAIRFTGGLCCLMANRLRQNFVYLSMSTYVITPTVEQEKLIAEFLEAQHIPFFKDDEEELPPHVLEGITQGQADIAAGRFITFEEFKKKHPVD